MSQTIKTLTPQSTKAFFIDMLVRDIGLTDCILDLVDNALDSLVEREHMDVMNFLLPSPELAPVENASIDIECSGKRFLIHDTCGGVSSEQARKQMFVFGSTDRSADAYGLGVYGIGMKRAFFKLGRHVVVKSAHNGEKWQVTWDVDDWKRSNSWDLSFDYVEPTRSSTRPGTSIEITGLHDPVARRFELAELARSLTNRISSAHSLFLKAGANIRVNTLPAATRLPSLLRSDRIEPVRKSLTVDGVDVLIIAGLTPKSDRTPRGWYVFCNGRMVLEADKSERTGWGDLAPQFHTKYNHFVGYVYFRSKEVDRLPWMTTKEGVDRESPVYQRALAEMVTQAKPILSVLNDLYPADEQTEKELTRRVLDQAKPVAINALPQKDSVFEFRPAKRKQAAEVRIQYSRPRSQVDRIRKYLGDLKMSGSKVGEYTFDWFLKEECDE